MVGVLAPEVVHRFHPRAQHVVEVGVVVESVAPLVAAAEQALVVEPFCGVSPGVVRAQLFEDLPISGHRSPTGSERSIPQVPSAPAGDASLRRSWMTAWTSGCSNSHRNVAPHPPASPNVFLSLSSSLCSAARVRKVTWCVNSLAMQNRVHREYTGFKMQREPLRILDGPEGLNLSCDGARCPTGCGTHDCRYHHRAGF